MIDIKFYMCKRIYLELFFLFILVYLLNQARSYDECKSKVQAGSDYTLRCSSNLTSANNLVLRIDKKIIPQSQYKVLDEHTIEFKWKNIPRISTYVECYFRNQGNFDQGVLRKYLVAETAPNAVTSFKCISYDFQKLRCFFKKPPQFITTTIVTPSDDEKSPKINEFTLSPPKYDPERQKIYNFTIFSKNCFGERSQSFIVNHLENVIPGKPNVSLASVKPNSVVIRFTMHDKLYMEKGLRYDIKLLKVLFGVTVKLNTSSLNPNHVQNILQIDSLDAFQRYTLEAKIKSADTEDLPEMWSQPTTIAFQTPPKPPDRPPHVDAGSFYIDPEGFVHLYWEMLQENEYNGRNFKYQLQAVSNKAEIIRGGEKIIKNSFTAVYNLSKADYEFRIRSVNDEGASLAAVIGVPKIPPPPPRKVRSIYNNNTYRLFWDSPLHQELVESYTIFSCFSNGSNHNGEKCNGDFRFMRVSTSVTNVTITGANNFAVAANYRNESSGMIWIDCVVFRETDVGEINSIFITSVNATAINLQWFLTCNQKTLVKGYKLKYCRSDESICFHASLNAEREQASIQNLNPDTKYIIQISLISETIVGKLSTPVSVKTMEGVSSPPVDLQMCEITETSIQLTWRKPIKLNGQLRYYKIVYNDKRIDILDTRYLIAEKVKFNVTGLESNKVYNISVVAGTVADSALSNVLLAHTDTKEPPVISYIQVDEINHKAINLTWAVESETSKSIRVYEVKYGSKELNTTKNLFIFNQTSYAVENLKCFSSKNNYEFSVRAINIATHIPSTKCTNLSNLQDQQQLINILNSKILYDISSSFELEHYFSKLNYKIRLLHGPWSAAIPYKCNGPLMSTLVIIFAAVILVIICILITHALRSRIKSAKEIGIKYPLGMDPMTDENSNDCTTKMEEVFDSFEEISKQVKLSSQESVDDGYATGRESSLGSEIINEELNLFKGGTVRTQVKNLFTALSEESETEQKENETEQDNELHEFSKLLKSESKELSGYNIIEPNKSMPLVNVFPDIFDSNGYVRNNCLPVLNSTKKAIDHTLEQNESFCGSREMNAVNSSLFDSNGYVLKSAISKITAAKSDLNLQFNLHPPNADVQVNRQTNSDIFDSNGYVLKTAVSKVFPTKKSPLSKRQTIGLGAVKRKVYSRHPHRSQIFDSNGYVLSSCATEMLALNANAASKPEKATRYCYTRNPINHFNAKKFDANGYVLTARQIRFPYSNNK